MSAINYYPHKSLTYTLKLLPCTNYIINTACIHACEVTYYEISSLLRCVELSEVEKLKKKIEKGNHSSLIELLTDHKFDYKSVLNATQETLLHVACRNGHFSIVCTLIEVYHCNLKAVDSLGNSGVMYAYQSVVFQYNAAFCWPKK